jgi:hypothetical protein
MRITRLALAAVAALTLAGGGAAQAATYVVTEKTDAADAAPGGACDVDAGTPGDQCTLRAAIEVSNGSAGVADTMNFAIPGVGPQTITLTNANALPEITDPVTIDATTQPGWTANTASGFAGFVNANLTVVLDANNKSSLVIKAENTTVKGLVIQHASGAGISLEQGGNSKIQGNFIGTSQDGMTDEGNVSSGIVIDGSAGNEIGGTLPAQRNLISGNGDVFGMVSVGLALPYGIWVKDGVQNLITGNLIGTDGAGAAAVPNVLSAVRLGGQSMGDAGNAVVRGNLLSGNGESQIAAGVHVTALGEGIKILGNRIGTDATGTMAIPNTDGIELVNEGDGVEVGGPGAGEGNLISGNGRYGIYVNSDSHVIQGNKIGTNLAGGSALPNGQHGIYMNGQSLNQIGGTTPAKGNLISGNGGSGILLNEPSAGNLVQGNYIGTDVNGTADLGNEASGVIVEGGSGNRIGGGLFDPVDGGGGNVISGNGGVGVLLTEGEGPSADDNDILANRIGVDKNDSGALGNGEEGIRIHGGTNNVIGAAPHAGNVIAHNAGDGVAVESGVGGPGTGNELRANSIFENGGLGIDLLPDGVTANDAGDGDTGANKLQNFPVLTSLLGGAVTGTLSGTPTTEYTVELFRIDACDGSGNGEGKTSLGTKALTTDGNGAGAYSETIADVPANQLLSATATDPAGNTSEFSACRAPGDDRPKPGENPHPTPTPNPQPNPQPEPEPEPKPRCKDRRPPITTLKRPGLRGTGGNVHISARATLQLKGRSHDRPGCRSGVRMVQVSLARVNGLTGVNCRFIRRQDEYLLTPRKNCRKPTLFRARGTRAWKFTFDLELEPGDYRVQARATDKAGNKETPKKRRNIIDFTVR